MVGAAPRRGEQSDEDEVNAFVAGSARIAFHAGDSYNNGMRAYYFSLPLITWFADPMIFMATTLVVAFVLYRREFASPLLKNLRQASGQEH